MNQKERKQLSEIYDRLQNLTTFRVSNPADIENIVKNLNAITKVELPEILDDMKSIVFTLCKCGRLYRFELPRCFQCGKPIWACYGFIETDDPKEMICFECDEECGSQ